MTMCMHWEFDLKYTDTTVTRTCVECGETDTRGRCTVPKPEGERCRGPARPGRELCPWHDPLRRCEALRKDGEPCTAPARPDDTLCSSHARSRLLKELREREGQ